MEVPENLKEKFSAFGSKIKVGGAEVGRKVSARMNSVSGRMKEMFQVQSPGEKLVEEVTAENLRAPDWARFMEICDMLNDRRLSGQEVVRGIKKRLANRNAGVQLLALTLLETCVKNHEKMFSELASERVLDEMVKLAEDPQTWPRCRDKALAMIEAWGESTEELSYLPVFEETYKSMRARGVRFPGRDASSMSPIFTPKASENSSVSSRGVNFGSLSVEETLSVAKNSVELLSTLLGSASQEQGMEKFGFIQDELMESLVEQCRQAQVRVQGIAQKAGHGDDSKLFEALSVNDELQQVIARFEELSASVSSPGEQKKNSKTPDEPAMLTAQSSVLSQQ